MEITKVLNQNAVIVLNSFHKSYTFIDQEMFEAIKNKYKESYKLTKRFLP